METKLTVVVDNISNEDLQGEWGLCIHAKVGENNVLIDTGASNLFAKNMEKLGLDIAGVDYGAISHAHYDHSNGLQYFFDHNDKAKFYLRESAAENCYHKKFIFYCYIGLPRHIIKRNPDRLAFVSGDYKLCDGVYLIPHKTPGLEAIGKREMMYVRTKKGWKPDDFSHEQSVVIDTDKGLVIINSCSHGGAVNIINEVKETFPDKHIYGLIGGFHLYNKSEEEVKTLAEGIISTGIDYICTGHCTMNRAYHILKDILGDKLEQLQVGKIIKI